MKKLVRGVVLNNLSDSSSDLSDRYQILKISLDDEIMSEIKNEGRKYNLSDDQIISAIRQADDRIRFTPGIFTDYSTIDATKLSAGQHIVLHFLNDKVNEVSISVVVIGNGQFLILDSAIGGLCYKDIIVTIQSKMQMGVRHRFKIYRNGVLMTQEYEDYCPGKLLRVDYYHPATIFELMDYDDDFIKECEPSAESRKQVNDKNTVPTVTPKLSQKKAKSKHISNKEAHYVWFPRDTEPLSWALTSNDDDPTAPFKIEIEVDGKNGHVSANPAFRFNENLAIRIYEKVQIAKCNDNDIDMGNDHQSLTTICQGEVVFNPKRKLWELTKKPIITSL